MKDKTIYLIKAKDEFELVKLLNEIDTELFATQPMQKNDGTWVCFCYKNKEKDKKTIMATEKQIDLLYQLDIDISPESLTKKEASKLIKEAISKKKSKNGNRKKER